MEVRILFCWAGNIYNWRGTWPFSCVPSPGDTLGIQSFIEEGHIKASDFSCFMKEKLLRKVIHVHLIHSRKNYYFGSVNAIFKKLSEKELGCTENTLSHVLTEDGMHHITSKALIIRSRLMT